MDETLTRNPWSRRSETSGTISRCAPHRGRNQPDPVGVGAGGAGERQQPLHLEGPLRQVVVAGPAEPAERGTASRHLDQELVRHLGVPGEDVGGRRREPGVLAHAGAHHRMSAVDPALEHAAVLRVFDLVGGGHVEPGLVGETPEAPLAGLGLQDAGESREQSFRLAHPEGVHEGGERLRIQEGDGTAGDHQRIPGGPVRRQRGDPGELEHFDQMDQIGFEGDRERHHVEAAYRAPALERAQGESGPPVLVHFGPVREEEPLAHRVGQEMEEAVHRLKAHVGHPERVAVRVTDGDPQSPRAVRRGNRDAGVRPLEPGFPGAPSLGPLPQEPAHAPEPLITACPRSSRSGAVRFRGAVAQRCRPEAGAPSRLMRRARPLRRTGCGRRSRTRGSSDPRGSPRGVGAGGARCTLSNARP